MHVSSPKRASLPCRLALDSSQNTNEKQFLTALMTKNWNQNSNAAPFQPLDLAELMRNAINNFPHSEQEPKNAQYKLPWKMWDWSTFLLLVSRTVGFTSAKPLWPKWKEVPRGIWERKARVGELQSKNGSRREIAITGEDEENEELKSAAWHASFWGIWALCLRCTFRKEGTEDSRAWEQI